jgi:hypothetical protein
MVSTGAALRSSRVCCHGAARGCHVDELPLLPSQRILGRGCPLAHFVNHAALDDPSGPATQQARADVRVPVMVGGW